MIRPHRAYISQLREFDKRLHGVYSVLPGFLSLSYDEDGSLVIAHENWTKKQSTAYKTSQKMEKVVISPSNEQSVQLFHGSSAKDELSNEKTTEKGKRSPNKPRVQCKIDDHKENPSVASLFDHHDDIIIPDIICSPSHGDPPETLEVNKFNTSASSISSEYWKKADVQDPP